MSSRNMIIYKEMKDVPKKELKDLQDLIQSAMSDTVLSKKLESSRLFRHLISIVTNLWKDNIYS